MLNDLRYALRVLIKAPSFSIIAIATLALGIGANTAIFTLVENIFLRGLPFAEQDRIVRIYGEAKERNLQQLPFSVPRFWHFRDAQTAFSSLAADTGAGFILTGMGEPVQLNGSNVTANYFQLLGVRPLRGRLFLPNEEDKADVAIISEHFWRKQLASDPNVIGRRLNLNGRAATVVGVIPTMPLSWFGLDCEIWMPKPFELSGMTREQLMRGVGYLRCIGRLKPGVTIEQAKTALAGVQASYRAANPGIFDGGWTVTAVPVTEDALGNLRPAFVTLLAAVAVVLLIACSNVANLLLVRFTSRRREIALRAALGASRRGLVRLFIFESTLLSLIAGLLGLLFASWIISLAPRIAGSNVPIEQTMRTPWPVFAFAFALSLLTGLAIGLYPAWQSSQTNLVDGLKDGGRAISGSIGQHRIRRALIAAQVALSVLLLAGAALLLTSFYRLRHEQMGFRSEGIWIGGIALTSARYTDEMRARFVDRLQTELRNMPGVDSAAMADSIPLTNSYARITYAKADGTAPPPNERPVGVQHLITPNYFRTLGIPLLSGRDFNQQDLDGHPLVTIINRTTAEKLFPGSNAVGQRLLFGASNGGLLTEIIGVVGDVRSVQISQKADVELYRPIAQRPATFLSVAVRSARRPEMLLGTVRAALDKVDRELPIIQPQSMQQIVGDSLGQQRLTITLLGSFASIALLLAIVGIYGAVAYTVEQRTGEIGVRMALGAQARDVLRLILSQGMKPVLLGLCIGLVSALALSGLLTSQLYQVSAYNPALLLGTAFVLASVALFACLVPARRATQVNPIVALRYE